MSAAVSEDRVQSVPNVDEVLLKVLDKDVVELRDRLESVVVQDKEEDEDESS